VVAAPWLELCKDWLLNVAAPETCIRDISAADFFQAAGAEEDFFRTVGGMPPFGP